MHSYFSFCILCVWVVFALNVYIISSWIWIRFGKWQSQGIPLSCLRKLLGDICSDCYNVMVLPSTTSSLLDNTANAWAFIIGQITIVLTHLGIDGNFPDMYLHKNLRDFHFKNKLSSLKLLICSSPGTLDEFSVLGAIVQLDLWISHGSRPNIKHKVRRSVLRNLIKMST